MAAKRKAVRELAGLVERASEARSWVSLGVSGGKADIRLRPLEVDEATAAEILALLRRRGWL